MTVVVGDRLTLDDVVAVAVRRARVDLAFGLSERMAPARAVVEDAVASDRTVYGITTGIGHLANVRIPASEALRMQADLLRAHATAVGRPLPAEIVRAMMLLKARTFAFGISGVRFEIVQRLVWMLNAKLHPVVPSQGSLGASGDLALLAHLGLPLIGEGEVEHEGRRFASSDALRAAGAEPLTLSYKEGLSLINGTEGMLAIGITAFARAAHAARTADLTGAMSLEACLGTDRAFEERLVALRAHPGSAAVAANLRVILSGSEIVASHRDSPHLVQDAYSLRCIPQVHGAYRDGLAYVGAVLEAELQSAIDNPSVLPGTQDVLSGGNFHGESLAVALDHLGLCTAGFATIAERRVARLVDPNLNNGLPAFLTADPGRSTGFMIAQYTAASLASENRGLVWPASSDSIPTSAGQEDHVSMGATAARRAAEVVSNTEHVLAIEALAAAQGLDLRAPLSPAPATAAALAAVRTVSPTLARDRPLAADIAAVRELAAAGALVAAAESECGAVA